MLSLPAVIYVPLPFRRDTYLKLSYGHPRTVRCNIITPTDALEQYAMLRRYLQKGDPIAVM